MHKNIKLQKDYTQNSDGYQLKLPLNIETIIPEDDSVRLLSQFVEGLDLTDLYSTYKRINSVSPRTLLKIVLYSYMNHDYSSRSMELNCKRDINFMYLLEGAKAPDHATFARFRSIHFALKEQEGLVFVHGIGKRKSPLQKSIEKLEEYLAKLKEYTQKVYVCGSRNSYSKTDHDATFMRMKEDAMGNGQLKPAFNLQHGVDSEYITWLTIGPQPTDATTLIPFLKEAEEYLDFKYEKIVADAGYESEENYLFMEQNGQISFIKPSNYEISKSRKYKNDISRVENMDYIEKDDCYICKFGRKLEVSEIKHSKSKTGYVSEKTIYRCVDCKECPYKSNCIKGNNCKTPLQERTKKLYVAKLFQKQRKEDLERILTEEGCMLRMNRSIQAEGSFGELKQDMSFRRYLSRETQNVTAESILLAIAHNINKLHNKIQNGKTGRHLFSLKQSA